MTEIRLWDSLENFSGESAALRRDNNDKVHVTICPAEGFPNLYALTDEEWIGWQHTIEKAPAVLQALRAEMEKARDDMESARESMEANPDDIEWPGIEEGIIDTLRALMRIATAAGLDVSEYEAAITGGGETAAIDEEAFKAFQATRRAVEDLGQVIRDDSLDGLPGFVYLDKLFIETNTPAWEGTAAEPYAAMLTLGREQFLSNDLDDLERKLYEFAVSEGYSIPAGGEG